MIVLRMTDDQFWSLTNALEAAQERFKGHAASLREIAGDPATKAEIDAAAISRGAAVRLAEQFDRQVGQVGDLLEDFTQQYEREN
jgi:hypothetical protein